METGAVWAEVMGMGAIETGAVRTDQCGVRFGFAVLGLGWS